MPSEPLKKEIKLFWDEYYPKCPPVGHLFKFKYPDLWFRIHSLPESKRYPETWDEYQEIFRRHNTLCSDLFLKSESIYLLLTQASHTKKAISPKYINHNVFSIFHMTSIHMAEISNDFGSRSFWHVWSCNFRWIPGNLNELFKKVADEEIVNLIFVDTYSRRVYHPYDGGADVLLASSIERDSYKIKYSMWLSARPDGL